MGKYKIWRNYILLWNNNNNWYGRLKMGVYISYFVDNPMINIDGCYAVDIGGYDHWSKYMVIFIISKKITSSYHPNRFKMKYKKSTSVINQVAPFVYSIKIQKSTLYLI